MKGKIVVAGSNGLVGKSVLNQLKLTNFDYKGITRKDANLLDYNAVLKLIDDLRPTCIIDAAAVVGGIKYNSEFPVKFLSENLEIQNNLMRAAHEVDVEKFIFLGSSCVYPRNCPQPIKEEFLLTGSLEQTNSAYAIAKIAGIEMVKSYRKQFGKRWISLMPTNIYGPFDNFDLNHSHVIPALIRKFMDAKKLSSPSVEVWGSGDARREFMFAEDLADAIIFTMVNYDEDLHLNIGFGYDVSVRELAELIAELTTFSGKVLFNRNLPEGTPQKLLDSSRLFNMGWKPKYSLRRGIELTIDWYNKNYMELNSGK
jgi:GDP-L-fucose synthase